MQKQIKLPHIDAIDHCQFVTYRTNDSVDAYMLNLLNDKNLKSALKQYKIDNYLDSSKNGSYLNDSVLEYLYDFLKSLNTEVYELISFVIMPNHVHILFKQIKPISETVKILKAKSAKNINILLNKDGKFWASDYYDKVIRDEDHFTKVYEYIKNNATKAGLSVNGRFYSKYEM